MKRRYFLYLSILVSYFFFKRFLVLVNDIVNENDKKY